MKKIEFLFGLSILFVLLAGCGSADQAVNQASNETQNNQAAALAEPSVSTGTETIDPATEAYEQVIVTVNEIEITTEVFQKRVKWERYNLVQEYNLVLQYAVTIADPNVQMQYQSYAAQIAQSLEVKPLGQRILNQMIDEVLIIEEAEASGITVSDDEVTDAFYALFGYFPEGSEDQAGSSTVVPTSTLSPTQLALITPTPTPEGYDPGQSAEEGMQTGSSITENEFYQQLGGFLDRVGPLGVDEDLIREILRTQLYLEKLSAELVREMPYPTEEEVWARHILIQPEGDKDVPDALAEAEEIIQLLAEGGDFGDLARERSDGPSGPNGGDLGWFGRGQMVSEFEGAAFSGEIGEILGPVETQFGFHVIQILGKEMRPITDSAYQEIVSSFVNDMLEGLWGEAEIVFEEGWEEKIPSEPALVPVGE